MQPWFLGINPRGLVPVLVHDGAVHIESNDIIQYLERTFPTPRLIPAGHENEVAALLRHEDDLHLDLRTLSFRFVFAPPGPPKPAAALESYRANGSGTVQGTEDHEKQIQIEFWQRAAKEGFTDERARASALKFRAEFDALDKKLAQQPYLMGGDLSVLDIAWLIYAHRLSLAGYPFRAAASARACLGRETARNAGIRQGSNAAAPFAGSARHRPPRPGWQDLGNGRGVLEHDREYDFGSVGAFRRMSACSASDRIVASPRNVVGCRLHRDRASGPFSTQVAQTLRDSLLNALPCIATRLPRTRTFSVGLFLPSSGTSCARCEG